MISQVFANPTEAYFLGQQQTIHKFCSACSTDGHFFMQAIYLGISFKADSIGVGCLSIASVEWIFAILRRVFMLRGK